MPKYKILIVEDESIVAMDLKQRLIAMDYEVTATVSNGAAAIEQVSACLPNLILMDIQIKGDIDGIETSHKIQEQFDVPIVFLTANSDAVTVERAKSTGPLAYLLKPFEDRDLRTTIEIALYRFQLEQKLKASESWLQAVLKSISDAVIASDIEGRVVFINSIAEHITGWESNQAKNMDSDKLMKLVIEDTEKPVNNPIKQCLRDGIIVGWTNHTNLENSSGQKIPIEFSAAPIQNNQGTQVGCVMVFRDVTIAREAELKIVGYQDQLKKLLTIRTDELDETVANLSQETTKRCIAEEEALDLSRFPEENPDPVLRISKDGKLVYANRASTLILDSWNCEIKQLVPEKWMNIVSQALSSGAGSNIEVEVENCTYSLVVAPIVSSGYVNLYGKDITLQKQYEEKERELQGQLERAERMKALGLLAGGIAHDLNNMLGPLVGYPELILRELEQDSPLRKQIESMQKSAKDAAVVIQDLLALARRGRYELAPLNLNKLVKEYLDSPNFRELSENNFKITFENHLESNLPNIIGSSPHLLKVIMNLIVNAIDAMRDTGTLIIETHCEQIDKLKSGYGSINSGEYVVLTIKDTGCGIARENLESIFEPYFSNKKMHGRSGSGLGLSVVYGIVKDHNGYYDVLSQVGEGTEFILYFPITLEAEKIVPISNDVPEGNETILVVDDDSGQRNLSREILSELGYKVFVVDNGTKAVEFIKNKTVDLILLDMIMEEGFDGLDTYRKIIKYHPHQKAIIVSGFSANDRVEEVQKLGAGAFIKKPFEMKILADAVRIELDKTIKVASKV